MPRTLLCSAGTSIAQGCKALSAFQNRPCSWEADTSELAAQIRERLKGLDLKSELGRVKASAELNALHRLPVRQDDDVVLFVTDTADGRCCAEMVQKMLAEHFGVARVTIERIKGLQVRDGEELRRTGLINLTRRLIHYLDDPQRRSGGGCVLNTNGGFKGLVPFFAILGMTFRAPVVYVFELAECLITLPPLPIGFATDLFERALPAIQWAQTKVVFNPEDFLRRVRGFSEDEREWFGSFLEVADAEKPEDCLASLSPLVQVLAHRELEGALEVWLSPDARQRYGDLIGDIRSEAEDHFRKLASALWRSQHRASKHGSDLEFYPEEGARDPWRFAGFTEEKRFYLGWFTNQKKEYLNNIAKHQGKDYQTSAFERLEVPAPGEAEVLPVDDPDHAKSWVDLRAECLRLRQEAGGVGLKESETVAKLKRKIEGLEAAITGRDRKLARLTREKREAVEQLQRAEAIGRLAKKFDVKKPPSGT